jgi:hypothetical protein
LGEAAPLWVFGLVWLLAGVVVMIMAWTRRAPRLLVAIAELPPLIWASAHWIGAAVTDSPPSVRGGLWSGAVFFALGVLMFSAAVSPPRDVRTWRG